MILSFLFLPITIQSSIRAHVIIKFFLAIPFWYNPIYTFPENIFLIWNFITNFNWDSLCTQSTTLLYHWHIIFIAWPQLIEFFTVLFEMNFEHVSHYVNPAISNRQFSSIASVSSWKSLWNVALTLQPVFHHLEKWYSFHIPWDACGPRQKSGWVCFS